MGLEDVALLVPPLLSFLPAYIGSKLDYEDKFIRLVSWALYALSFLLGMFSIQITHLALTRLFGGAPTATETSILNLLAYFNFPIIIYFILFGMLLVLLIIVYFVQYIGKLRFGKTPTR